MADKLLKIAGSTLDSIALAIRTKNGSAMKMSPSEMSTAIETLDTYAAATKLTHTDYKITPNVTSYNIPTCSGNEVHDGTEVVYIELDSAKTVAPSTTQQTVTPDSGKFLSSVTVNGTGSSGYKIFTDTVSISGSSFAKSGLDFTPVGVMLIGYDVSGVNDICCLTFINGIDSTYHAEYYSIGRAFADSSATASFGAGSFSVSTSKGFDGTYRYMTWGR